MRTKWSKGPWEGDRPRWDWVSSARGPASGLGKAASPACCADWLFHVVGHILNTPPTHLAALCSMRLPMSPERPAQGLSTPPGAVPCGAGHPVLMGMLSTLAALVEPVREPGQPWLRES